MPLEDLATYADVCRRGYHSLGYTLDSARAEDAEGWQFGPGLPPSYAAMGRYRFLETLARARRLAPRSILEVAAGGGFLAACLVRAERRVLVNDLRPLGDTLRHWRTGTAIEFVQGNVFELGPDTLGRFDLVIAAEIVEHVSRGVDFLAHLRRFLTPGGTLLLTTPNGDYVRSDLPTWSDMTEDDFRRLETDQFKPDADGHLYLYRGDELRGVLTRAGYEDVEVTWSITPFISGHAGFRWLPRRSSLLPLYCRLDRLVSRTPLARRLCTQLMAVARQPAPRPSPSTTTTES
jgi:2-polyprenyl-6-hydroxyphenyl methylase/3-demethylubiquinone-9 3-methyltransferase